MDVSIIFVNYNTVTLLINAINSVVDKTKGISYEIIVVDNASSDGAHRLLIDKFNNRIEYIQLSENIGFGRANNEGIKIAQGKNIFLLNPDTILKNNAIKFLSDYLDNNDKVGVVGANLYNEDNSHQPSFSLYYPSIGYEMSNLFHVLFFYERETFNKTMFPLVAKRVVGAALMVKKSIIEEVGGFDPRFFMYAEEDELCYRVRKAGYKIVNVPQAQIMHLDGKSFQFSEQRQKRKLEGLRTFYKISYSSFYCQILRVVEYLTIISRLIIFKVLNKPEEIVYWVFMYNNRKWQ
ncbi:MAG: glycosyltransferase family 2 [Mucilaginibacter sp.]|nr:glycosyltransferase family 2 [Mucilaginibacter sp.]